MRVPRLAQGCRTINVSSPSDPKLASCFSGFHSGSSHSGLPGPLGCQLWSAGPGPEIGKEALERRVGRVLKRGTGSDRGGWGGPRGRGTRRRAPPHGRTARVSTRPMPALLQPSIPPLSSLAGSQRLPEVPAPAPPSLAPPSPSPRQEAGPARRARTAGNALAASLRRSHRAEAAAAEPGGLAVGGEPARAAGQVSCARPLPPRSAGTHDRGGCELPRRRSREHRAPLP